jgi:hypothetical protein
MNPQLTWIAASPPSLLYAAAQLAEGRALVDAAYASQLQPIVAETSAELEHYGVEPRRFWTNVVPWSAGLASSVAPEIANRLASVLQVSDSPLANDELALRSGPLRAAWEARGPGLWRLLMSLMDNPLPTLSANVILVRPVCGGGGSIYVQQAAISLEAMLANPHPELPEVTRLAWLLMQLAGASRVGNEKRFALRLVPMILAAGEVVELTRCDQSTLATALRAWHLGEDPSDVASIADDLSSWRNKLSGTNA